MTRRCSFSSFDVDVTSKTVVVCLNEVTSEEQGGHELTSHLRTGHLRSPGPHLSGGSRGTKSISRSCRIWPCGARWEGVLGVTMACALGT